MDFYSGMDRGQVFPRGAIQGFGFRGARGVIGGGQSQGVHGVNCAAEGGSLTFFIAHSQRTMNICGSE